MNGTTEVDETLNPCTADVDKHTYGFRFLNVTTRGQRLLKVFAFGLCLDLYWSGFHRVFYARHRNGGTLFFPGGCVSWER